MLGVVLGVWAILGCATAGARQGGETVAPGQRDEPERERRTMTEKVAGRAAGGAIEETLRTLDTPENRERLPRILASPPMQAAARDITASIVGGVFDGVDRARASGQLPTMPSADDIGRSIGRSIDRDISPATGRLVHNTIDSALDAALSDENSGRIEAVVHRIGASVTTGFANAIRDEVGPALAVTLERDILPAIGRGLQSPDVQAAIVKSVSSLGVGAARGTQAGFAEADSTSGRPSVGGTLAAGAMAAIAAAVSFAVLFIVMTVLLIRSNRRQRDLAEESRRREERFLAVLEGRADTHGEPITSPGLAR
jgi:hypothetical protein